MKSRSTPFDLQPVPGYPQTLQLYRIEASTLWQVRFYTSGKYIRKSTGTSQKREAIAFAKSLFDRVKLADRLDISMHPHTFKATVSNFLIWQKMEVNNGKLSERWHKEDVNKLNHDMLSFFGPLDLKQINKSKIEQYFSAISERRLSKSTLNKHVNLLRKLFKYAKSHEPSVTIPDFPAFGNDANPRPYFDEDSFGRMYGLAARWARTGYVSNYRVKGKSVRKLHFTNEFSHFIIIATNVFVRVSDLKDLKNKHVKLCGTGDNTYLEIFPPHSKTVSRSSVSMQIAVAYYAALLGAHAEEGLGGPDDFVFFPQHRNRKYAYEVIRRLFEHLLDKSGTRADPFGRHRTLYSLRHTALMNRFLYGDSIDIFLLAKNALTSVDMLEKFYLSHAETKTRIQELQSFKR